MKKKKKINVLVTAVGGRAIGYQILECLKYHPDKYRIVATDIEAFSPGLYESSAGYLLPLAKSKKYIPAILKLSKHEKIDIILPGSEPEVLVIAKNSEQFTKKGIIPLVNPYKLVKISFDKLKLYKYLEQKQIRFPPTTALDNLDDAQKLHYPIVLKPCGISSGSKNVHIIKNLDELKYWFKKLSKQKIKLLAQEYVGSEYEEYTVGIIVSKNGRIIDSIVMRRYLTGLTRGEERIINSKTYVLSTGYSQGYFVNQPDVKKHCEEVAIKVGARGPLNIQCRRDKKGIYILEVHARFSGSASQRAVAGFNEPHILIQDFLGKKVINKISHKLDFAVMRKFANVAVETNIIKKMELFQ